jgi:hypothetical protein
MQDFVPNFNVAAVRRAFSETPWIFVYRDPAEVMMSLLDRGNGALSDWDESPESVAAVAGMPSLADRRLSRAQVAAMMLGELCRRIAEAARSERAGLFLAVNYDRLPRAVWETIAPHFGFGFDEPDKTAMNCRAAYHSKDPNATFVPDSGPKRERAPGFVKELIDAYVRPHLEEITRLPQG